MRNRLLLLGLTFAITFGDVLIASAPDSPPRIIQDPKTKIVYYLESDQRHIAAIAPDGKLLWCIEVLPSPDKIKGCRFISFGFWQPGNFPPDTGKGEDCIVYYTFVGTMMTTVINKQTGAMVGAIGE